MDWNDFLTKLVTGIGVAAIPQLLRALVQAVEQNRILSQGTNDFQMSVRVEHGPNGSRWRVIDLERQQSNPTDPVVPVPIRGPVGAGERESDENQDYCEYFPLPVGLLPQNVSHAYRVKEWSMAPFDKDVPGVLPNTLVLCATNTEYVPNRTLVVAKSSDGVLRLRQYRESNGRRWLESLKGDRIDCLDGMELFKVEAVVPEEVWQGRTDWLEWPIEA